MNIVKEKWNYLNSTLNIVPRKINRLYKFGVLVLALRKINSLRANARMLNLNFYTAKSKIYRLTKNKRILELFPKLIKFFGLVSSKDIIACDFSDFGNKMQVLMFAKQTRKGRTIPIYFKVLQYPIDKDSQNLFVIKAIENLETILGFKLKLVFDRGFACPSIIEYLAKERHTFYIRIKKGKSVVDLKYKKKMATAKFRRNDLIIKAYNRKLRLVISDKDKDIDEPWYIITNDFKSTRKRIIEIYYFRFEIEEFFRDAKRLLGIEQVNFKSTVSLSIILWFVMLGIWFIWTIKEEEQERVKRDKMQLSLIRYYLEKINSEIILLAESKFMNKFLLDSG